MHLYILEDVSKNVLLTVLRFWQKAQVLEHTGLGFFFVCLGGFGVVL